MEIGRASRGMPSLGMALRHHLLAVLMATLLTVGAGAAFLTSQDETYTSTATVLLSPAPGNPLTAEAASGSTIQFTVAMQTEAELVRSPAIRDVVAGELGRPAPGPHEVLAVEVPSNTQMVDVSITSDSPGAAQEVAQAFADGFLAYRAERATRSQQSRVETLQQRLEEADEELRRATTEAAESGESSYASREVELLVDRIARLGNSLSEAEAVSTSPGSIINPALLPERADGLPRALLLAAVGVVGLVLGSLLALLLEWRRDLIRASDEAAELGVSVFSTVRHRSETELAPEASEELHEAYRRLRAGVIANGPRPHVLAVSGITPDHISAVATNLALVLAEAEFSVLLIAADVEGSQVEDILGVGPRPGLSEAVRDIVPASESLLEVRGFSLLTTGLEPGQARDLNASPAFSSMVAHLRSRFDYVVLASAPTGAADGDAIISVADSVLLVLQADQTTKGRLLAALERFQQLGIRHLGAVKIVAARGGEHQARPKGASGPGEDVRESAVAARGGAHA